MKWPEPSFQNNDTEQICNICGAFASNNAGPCLRQAVQYFYTVCRSAQGVQGYIFL